MPFLSRSTEVNIHPILGALRSVPIAGHPDRAAPPSVVPFVTISRAPAIDADELAKRLVELLNAELQATSDADCKLWSFWDRELVETVAVQEKLSQQLIETLEDSAHSWLRDFFSSLSFSDGIQADEARVYRRVATLIRALAQAGRVVLVGRGAAQITRQLTGGIHVRLVAPIEFRLEKLMQREQLTRDAAMARLRELDHNRHTFYRRYWGRDIPGADQFAMTLNAAELSPQTMARAIHVAVMAGPQSAR